MKIAVIGAGYVGLVTGTCFAEMGNDVISVDVNKEKIDNLNNGKVPIYEPGLEQMVKENVESGQLTFTTDLAIALKNSEVCFIAVGTPMGEDGGADLTFILEAAKNIGMLMKRHMYIVNKSTVPVGTADKVRTAIQDELEKRGSILTFDVISNPEFLKEGAAIDDFLKPDRVVVGADNDKAFELMRELYSPFIRGHERLITMDIKSAEMTKYAANAMLATKISFINEIANICEKVGADANKVRTGIGSDSRIGYSFIFPGCGYGGSCFPKDVQALIKTAQENDYTPTLLQSVESVNCMQKKILVQKVVDKFGTALSGKTFAIWGLSFKPETDDMREASSIVVINELTKLGAKIRAYDPKAIHEAKQVYLKNNDNIEYVESKYTALNRADALLLITEWKEFRSPDFDEMAKRLKQKIIFDGRNQFKQSRMKEYGFEYYQIGVVGDL